ncbi:hypothetical protein [Streptomyces sp. NPDC059788]
MPAPVDGPDVVAPRAGDVEAAAAFRERHPEFSFEGAEGCILTTRGD